MKLKLAITQITHGFEYNGSFELNKITFEYNLKFGVPIDQLDDQVHPNETFEELQVSSRKILQFDLTKNKQKIEIDWELFCFLVQFVAKSVLEFYNNPQVIDSNKGIIGSLMRKDDRLFSLFGTSAAISMASSFDIEDEFIPLVLQ